ncbi:MAG: NTP transferase domain-containing protein [Nitrospirae bacterium]|nr:NTP transferase domain-containing protein [Nitrospirota bacterium]
MKKIQLAVIPAAGLGTRFFPITKSIAKEMLPIVDKPCIQYLVEEAVKSGIKEIIIITGKEKHSIKDYFTPNKVLIKELKEKGKTALIKNLEKIEKMAKITFVNQDKPLGDGHALLCAKKEIGKRPFAVLFGDDIYDSRTPALKQLITQYEKLNTPIIGLIKINKKDSKKYGMIVPKKSSTQLHKIKSLVEKPTKAPSNLAIIGKYIVTKELFDDLKAADAKEKGELRLIDGMIRHLAHSPIHGYEISGKRFDTGDKKGYLDAVIHFAKT